MKKTNYLAEWIYQKSNTDSYKKGSPDRGKHLPISHLIDRAGGMSALTEQIEELTKLGLIQCEYGGYMNKSISGVYFHTSNMGTLCRFLNVPDPRDEFNKDQENRIAMVTQYMNTTECEWLKAYYQSLLDQLQEKKLNTDTADENVFRILNALIELKEDVWVRTFSARVLNGSKVFERGKYSTKVCKILKSHSEGLVKTYGDDLDNDQILELYHLHRYAQTLSWKGPLEVGLNGNENAVLPLTTGNIVNSQTLNLMKVCSVGTAKRIVTIENKAIYEEMTYDPDTLYIYTHGFPSRKEMRILQEIAKMEPDIQVYHWGDMDYGGIRIYQFLKQNAFPALKPLNMDKSSFEKAISEGYGAEIDKNKREKLIALTEPDLKELKDCILKTGMEIEQEML